jgi:hypothetical protein
MKPRQAYGPDVWLFGQVTLYRVAPLAKRVIAAPFWRTGRSRSSEIRRNLNAAHVMGMCTFCYGVIPPHDAEDEYNVRMLHDLTADDTVKDRTIRYDRELL